LDNREIVRSRFFQNTEQTPAGIITGSSPPGGGFLRPLIVNMPRIIAVVFFFVGFIIGVHPLSVE
jgi:hypothetical protein